MLRVGLTGGIACGKSAVGEMLVRRGAHLLDADRLAHDLYAPGAVVYEQVIRHFGREILNPNGTVNRARLARAAFPDRIVELNSIVHPAVVRAQNCWMEELAREDPDGVAVVEAALLIEAGAHGDFDKVIVVTCKPEQKVERYAQRAGVSLDGARTEVERRSAAQFSDEDKMRHADFVIDNSGTLEETDAQVEKMWKHLRG